MPWSQNDHSDGAITLAADARFSASYCLRLSCIHDTAICQFSFVREVIFFENRFCIHESIEKRTAPMSLDKDKEEVVFPTPVGPVTIIRLAIVYDSLLVHQARVEPPLCLSTFDGLSSLRGFKELLQKIHVLGFYPVTADIPKKRHTVPKECSCPDAENIAQSSNAKPSL